MGHGIAPHSLVETEGIRPDFVVIGEPTDMKIYRGHQGRIELRCVTKGRSCHASMPHLGDNAVYKMTRLIQSLEKHNDEIRTDLFLGKGTVVLSIIECKSPSINGIYGAGKAGIPCIGFAPSDEVHAHTVEDQVPIEDAVRATEFYTMLPVLLGADTQARG